MCEVTKENFWSLLPEVTKLIDESKFVAIDAEFTGISLGDRSKFSLLDDGPARYQKMKAIAREFTVCQIGLSMFVKEQDQNEYVAHTYTFYLFPNPAGSHDILFAIQASSLSFLRQHGFNFDKWVRHGITYLNGQQETMLRQQTLGDHHQSDSGVVIQKWRELVGWLTKAKHGEQLVLGERTNYLEQQLGYILARSLPPEKVVINAMSGQLFARCLEPISDSDALNITDVSVPSWDHIVDEMTGFTHIFRHLCQSKKPVVGHNVLLDLLFMYDKFINDLPETYEEFKAVLHAALPNVFDTKRLCQEMKQGLVRGNQNLLHFSCLEDLYISLSSERALQSILLTPNVVHSNSSTSYDGQRCWHEAGYDAFMTGFVFIRVIHLAATSGVSATDLQKVKFSRYLQVASPYRNRVHVPRASLFYCNLEGPDSYRQLSFYHVSLRKGADNSAFKQLCHLVSGFGAVETHQLDNCRALVVVASRKSGEMLRHDFQDSTVFSVRPYQFFDSVAVRSVASWTCVVGLLVAAGYTFMKLR